MQNSNLHLIITVHQSRTVLPRCLQILSRRDFILTQLETENTQNDEAILRCTATGSDAKHEAIVGLLEKLIDVKKVEITK